MLLQTRKLRSFKFTDPGIKVLIQTELRINGFKRYIEEHLPTAKLFSIKIYAQDHTRNLKIIKDFFKQHPHIREAITFNSKSISDYGISGENEYLRYKIYRI